MKTLWKRSMSLILLIALPALLCANGQSEGQETMETPELTWYYIGTPQADEDVVEAALNEYIEPLIGATVNINCINWGSAYEERMSTIIGSGEQFDICFTSNWANNYKRNVSLNAFMPLNELVENTAPGIKEVLGEDFLYATSQNGKLYTLPSNKEKAHHFGLLLRKDLVEKYDMDISSVKTLDDMTPFFDIIKNNEPDVYPLGNWGSGDNLFLLLDWDRPVGSKVPLSFNADGEVVHMLEEDRTMDLFNQARDFYNRGYVQADSSSLSEFVADEAAGLVFATPKSLKPGKDGEYASTTPGYEWIQVDLTAPIMSNSETDGAMLAISVQSKHPEKAIKFIELLYTDKYVKNLMTYGIEDVHYNKIEGEVIRPVTDTKYQSGLGWAWGNQFNDYLTEGEALNKWEQFLNYNAAATPAANLGFSFNPENVSFEISACLNIWDQYLPSLTVGDVDDINTYKQEALTAFEAAGINVIREELQSQFDAWKASR